ncbi:phosphate ABC transporter, permease protein PstA, partial [Acinetobacter baumannii]|nr:phosphate ABC transporter, permease protein PstA [Acinetobacter baumannii]
FLLADGFNVAGFLVITAVLFVIGMYGATRVLENRRRATDGLWRHLVWLAFLIALAPLISVLWSVIATGLPTLISNPHL